MNIQKYQNNLSLATVDNETISIRHTAIGSKQVVVILPGFFQSKNTFTFRLIESLLCSQGFDVISVDFRGHGNSSGRYSFSVKEYLDVRSVIDYAQNKYTQIWALGFSMGGAIAIIEQAHQHKFSGLICVGSPMDFNKIEMQWWRLSAIKCQMRSIERGIGCRMGAFWMRKKRAIDYVQKIIDTPILFVHGTEDGIVFKRHSQELFSKTRGLAEIKLIEGGSHAEDLFRTHPDLMSKSIVEWIRRVEVVRSEHSFKQTIK